MSHPYRTARLRVYGGRGSRALALVGTYVSPSMRGSRGNIARHIRREAAPPPRPVVVHLPRPPYPGSNRPDRRRLSLHDLAERHALDGIPWHPWPEWTLPGWNDRRASIDAARRRRSIAVPVYVADLDARAMAAREPVAVAA